MIRALWLLWGLALPCMAGSSPALNMESSVLDEEWAILRNGISDQSPSNRVQAIAALATLGAMPPAVQLVEPALSDKDWRVRHQAAIALGLMGAKGSIPKLREALKDQIPAVSFVASKSLWELGDHSGERVLLDVLRGIRGASIGTVETARMKARDRNSLLLMGLREGISFFGPFGIGIDAIQMLRKDGSATARAVSAMLLAADPDPAALAALESALDDKNWAVRAAAVQALGLRGDHSAIRALQQHLWGEHDAVRYMAAASLVRLQTPGLPPPPCPAYCLGNTVTTRF
jgi:HEAT repeat protein